MCGACGQDLWFPVGSCSPSDFIRALDLPFVKCVLLTEVWSRGKGVGAQGVASECLQTPGELCLGGKPHRRPG